ncbi:MAG TPA: hypothetical protein VK804_08300 [Bradyrhizobium sp.]|uniref:hypothetical protein n=1 Tax=Bradyrhizobium sp. TaxID=376 RepID=UPI002B52DFE5|nr:hypothetical protein [Bradyrhizobium sp.]HTB00461.1 hypothetical protein [Bradyrhizobium sp.]
MSNIDQRFGNWRRKLVPSPLGLRQPSATESRSCSRPAQGSIVTSSQDFPTTIERPSCPRCQTKMMLERISTGPTGFEHRLFECPKCDHVEISVIASDRFKSNAAGWLAGELGPPN